MVPAVERTILIIEYLLQHPDGVSPQDIQQSMQISRSTMYAILRSLKDFGYVEQENERSPYQPGPRLLSWQRRPPMRPLDLIRAFYSESAHIKFNETLVLLIPVVDGLQVVAQVPSTHKIRSNFETGQIYSLESTAAGALFSRTILSEVYTTGYHLSQKEDEIELALPICSDGNYPDAALVCSAPSFRLSTEGLLECMPALREAAARLSYRLGAQVYTPFHSNLSKTIQSTQSLTDSEIREFLCGPWAARLACLRPDGLPHVVPVWHEWDGEVFRVIAWHGSRWGEYLQINPRISLTVDEPWPPLRRVSVHGYAEIIDTDQDQIVIKDLLERLSKRYLGQVFHPDFEFRSGRLFTIIPEKLSGWRGLQSTSGMDR